MKNLAWLLLFPFGAFATQTPRLRQIRALYHRAAEIKLDAMQLNKMLLKLDSSALPVVVCYKYP